MIRKAKLIETLDNLPDEFSIDDLVERLIVIQKVDEAREQSLAEKKLSEEEAKSRIKKWSK